MVSAMLMNMAAPLTDSFLMGIISIEPRGLASPINSNVCRLPHTMTTVIGGVHLGAGNYYLPFFLATAFYAAAISLFYLNFRGVEPRD